MLRYWGKISKDKDYDTLTFHPLIAHSIDVLNTAIMIASINNIVLNKYDLFLIAIHDLGKMSCGFQIGMMNFIDNLIMKANYFGAHEKRIISKYKEHHSISGANIFHIVRNTAMKDNRFLNSLFPEEYLSASFGHHGIPVKRNLGFKKMKENKPLGNFIPMYDMVPSVELIDFFMKKLSIDESDSFCSSITSWELAGLTCIADWIASNEDNFPYVGFDGFNADNYFQESEEKSTNINGNLLRFGSEIKDTSFKDTFGFDTPTELQMLCDETRPSDVGSGIFFMEDSAGSGKTEAAIRLAQKILLSSVNKTNGGIFFALPTMATSNSIYNRALSISKNLFSNTNVTLSHSDAKDINKKFASDKKYCPEDKMNTAEFDAFQWMSDNRKKSLLSHFGVGTIDSLLSAILPLKHQSLKMFGIRNKVLILDEVHSYDIYISKEIEALIEFHASNGGSVIISSATLTSETKNLMSKAFYKGLNNTNFKDHFNKYDPFPQFSSIQHQRDNIRFEMTPIQTPKHLIKRVQWEVTSNIQKVESKIKDCIDKGGNVCVIKNTINSAISFYDKLIEDGLTVSLFHSRFVKSDKQSIEKDIITKFGKKGSATGQVLVATQVAEHSLDIDFDLMVTDIAPAEYLIQRVGRCHRHVKNRPEGYEEPKVIVLAGNLDETWLSPNKGTSFVYRHVKCVWLTLQYLLNNPVINLPTMSREFIEYSYSDLDVPDFIQNEEDEALYKHDLIAKGRASLLILNTTEGYIVDSDKSSGDLWANGKIDADLSTRFIQDSVQVRIILDGVDFDCISMRSSKANSLEVNYDDDDIIARFSKDGNIFVTKNAIYCHKRGLVFNES